MRTPADAGVFRSGGPWERSLRQPWATQASCGTRHRSERHVPFRRALRTSWPRARASAARRGQRRSEPAGRTGALVEARPRARAPLPEPHRLPRTRDRDPRRNPGDLPPVRRARSVAQARLRAVAGMGMAGHRAPVHRRRCRVRADPERLARPLAPCVPRMPGGRACAGFAAGRAGDPEPRRCAVRLHCRPAHLSARGTPAGRRVAGPGSHALRRQRTQRRGDARHRRAGALRRRGRSHLRRLTTHAPPARSRQRAARPGRRLPRHHRLESRRDAGRVHGRSGRRRTPALRLRRVRRRGRAGRARHRASAGLGSSTCASDRAVRRLATPDGGPARRHARRIVRWSTTRRPSARRRAAAWSKYRFPLPAPVARRR